MYCMYFCIKCPNAEQGSVLLCLRARTVGRNRARIDTCVKGTVSTGGQGCEVFDMDILLSENSANSNVSVYCI